MSDQLSDKYIAAETAAAKRTEAGLPPCEEKPADTLVCPCCGAWLAQEERYDSDRERLVPALKFVRYKN